MDPIQLRAALQNGDITFEEYQTAMNRLSVLQGAPLPYPDVAGVGATSAPEAAATAAAPLADAGLGVEAAAPAARLGGLLDNSTILSGLKGLIPEGASVGGLLGKLGGAGADVGIPAVLGQLGGNELANILDAGNVRKAAQQGNLPAYQKARQAQEETKQSGLGAGIGTGLGLLLAPETGGLSALLAPALGGLGGGLLGHFLGGKKKNYQIPNDPAAQAKAGVQTVPQPDQIAWQNLVKQQGQQMQPYVNDMISQGNAYNTMLQQADKKLPPALAQMYSAENNLMASQIHQMADAMGAQSQNSMYQQLLSSIPVKFQAASNLLGSLSSGTAPVTPASSQSATQQALTPGG